MFWDPNFTDFTASTTDSIDFGWSGPNNYFDTNLFPRQMIPRVESWIATAYQGKKTAAPGYSISEYDFGGTCDTAIEGGVAEADLLGVFGREGLFGATMWPLQSVLETGSSTLALYSVAAFDLYRNYDGKGSVVGDTAVYASTPDVEHTSIYAFTSSTQTGEVDLVAVNKTADSLPFVATLANAPSLTQATAYQLVAGTIGVTLAAGSPPTVTCSGGNFYVTYTMPATSATTIILH
jgi:mannan endo-1,4-beta-mannosidase